MQMFRYAFLLFFFLTPAEAQQQPRPLPEEAAFSRLAPELQSLLGHLSPAEALYKVEFARQNLIALGQPNPSAEQLHATVQRLLEGSYVGSASAGATSFPPLSPLAAPPPPPLAR
jgi:hypothetical protein